MTLGAAAVVRPLRLGDVGPLRAPMVAMVLALAGVLGLSRGGSLGRRRGVALLGVYALFIVLVLA